MAAMKQMKRKANLSLLFVVLLFMGSVTAILMFPEAWWPRFLLYTAEAGLVGALADLFAVTALFRHPLGWKWIPHTAIIPNNRDKLVNGVVDMVEQQLLSKDMLKQKVREVRLVDRAISWVEDKSDERMIFEQGRDVLSKILADVDLTKMSGKLDIQIRETLLKMNVSPYAGKGLKWVLDEGSLQAWISRIVEYAVAHTPEIETKRWIRDMLEDSIYRETHRGNKMSNLIKKTGLWIAEATDSFNIDDAVEALYGRLQDFLLELRNPHHELRLLIEEMLYELAENLEHRTDVYATINDWKVRALERISFLPSVQALLESLRQLLTDDNRLESFVQGQPLVQRQEMKLWMGQFIQKYWDQFKADHHLLDWLEQHLQTFVQKVIETEHALIGHIVRETLEDYTDAKLAAFIESKVGEDLQRIRINGAFIGGMIGAGIYGFLHGIYQPLLDSASRFLG
ncbi:hypothetical protein BVG16_01310 [Paenibacillus selenitireducens]|uniref:DUF445 domain-containing protein n=1 Tax=Paenibacillus selenitireducens TaxID=1324314 RepID=A0A1T2XMU7_9BACL|nr:DUF445 domain-containing protein [Paenibacillus selenitireducens]OPA81013.1 hypothetical protein BVG16_01310 [Paenibacillus selenitireducens]